MWKFAERIAKVCGADIVSTVDEPSFSNGACDSCGSTKAGNRWDAVFVFGVGTESRTVDGCIVCESCVFMHANGEDQNADEFDARCDELLTIEETDSDHEVIVNGHLIPVHNIWNAFDDYYPALCVSDDAFLEHLEKHDVVVLDED